MRLRPLTIMNLEGLPTSMLENRRDDLIFVMNDKGVYISDEDRKVAADVLKLVDEILSKRVRV